MSGQDPKAGQGGPKEPSVGVRELDGFFRDLRQTVLDLEEAYRSDGLAHRLQAANLRARFGKALAKSYEGLLESLRHEDPEGRRLETVHALLDQTREELFHIDTWFHAEIHDVDEAGDDLGVSEIPSEGRPPIDGSHLFQVTDDASESVALRLDQVLAGRAWGIGLVFDDERATDRLTTLMARHALNHLALDLVDLTTLLPRVLRAEPGRFPQLVAARSGRRFEQLLVDILNENKPHAHLARLVEDYSQKTDLRVQYQNLDRRRGARVQVTMVSNPQHHQNKVNEIRRAEQYVILSPWSLSCAIDDHYRHAQAGNALFDDDLIARFWACVKGQPSDREALSIAIRDMLVAALHAPVRSARGPMSEVPEALRELIRVWVRAEATRSTRELRDWEAHHGRYRTTRDGRLRPRTKRPGSLSQEVKDFMRKHPEGSTIRARVSEVEHLRAWVRLSGNLKGRVSRSELSWAHARADARRVLRVDEDRDFMVLRAAERGPTVELSLKRLQDDPWQQPSLDAWNEGTQLMGRVSGHARYGLFLDVAEELVGLLHVSNLPVEEGACLSERWPLGTKLNVVVQTLDRENRRLALSLASTQERDGADECGQGCDASGDDHHDLGP